MSKIEDDDVTIESVEKVEKHEDSEHNQKDVDIRSRSGSKSKEIVEKDSRKSISISSNSSRSGSNRSSRRNRSSYRKRSTSSSYERRRRKRQRNRSSSKSSSRSRERKRNRENNRRKEGWRNKWTGGSYHGRGGKGRNKNYDNMNGDNKIKYMNKDGDSDMKDWDNKDGERKDVGTNNKDPKMVASRIFIGNTPPDIGKDELKKIFEEFGDIIGISVFSNYSFIQYDNENSAIQAKQLSGVLLHDHAIEVRVANENRQRFREPPAPPVAYPPSHNAPNFMNYPRPLQPPPRTPPPHCELILASPEQNHYAEMVHSRLRNVGIHCRLVTATGNAHLLVEKASLQGMLFAVNINHSNQMHHSITVNILHGEPQEHRNMPLDDAISLIDSSYLEFNNSHKTRLNTRALGANIPGERIVCLLNLLAYGNFVNVNELDLVIEFLMNKRIQLKKSVEQPMLQKQPFRSPPHNNVPFEGRQQYQQPSFPQQQSNLQQTHQQPIQKPYAHQQHPHQQTQHHSQNQQHAPHQYQHSSTQQPTTSLSSSSIATVLSSNNNPTLQKALNDLFTTDATILKNIVKSNNGDKINTDIKNANINIHQMTSAKNAAQPYAKNTFEEQYNGASGHTYDDFNPQPHYSAGVYNQYSNGYKRDQEKYNDYYKNYETH